MTKIMILFLSLSFPIIANAVAVMDYGEGTSNKYVFDVSATYSWEGLAPTTANKCMGLFEGKLYVAKKYVKECNVKLDVGDFDKVKDQTKPIISKPAIDRYPRENESTAKVAEEVYVKLNEDGTPVVTEINRDRPKTNTHGQHEGDLVTTTTTQNYNETFTVRQDVVLQPLPVEENGVITVTETPAVPMVPPDATPPAIDCTQGCSSLSNEVCKGQLLSGYCAQNSDCSSQTCINDYNKLKVLLKKYTDKIDEADAAAKTKLAAPDGPRNSYNLAKANFEGAQAAWKKAQAQWRTDQTAAFSDYRKAVREKNLYLEGQLKNNYGCIQSDGKNPNFLAVSAVEKKINSCENPSGKRAPKRSARKGARSTQSVEE